MMNDCNDISTLLQSHCQMEMNYKQAVWFFYSYKDDIINWNAEDTREWL